MKAIRTATISIGLLLALQSTCFAAMFVNEIVCPVYRAMNTGSATTYTCTCKVQLCPGQALVVDGCGRCSGTQYLKMYESSGAIVAQASGQSSTCAPCARIQSFQPNITNCRSYTLNEGCAANSECSGEVHMYVTNVSTPTLRSSAVQLAGTGIHSNLPRIHNDDDPPSGYCGHTDSNELSRQTVDIIVIGVVTGIFLFLCAFYSLCSLVQMCSSKKRYQYQPQPAVPTEAHVVKTVEEVDVTIVEMDFEMGAVQTVILV